MIGENNLTNNIQRCLLSWTKGGWNDIVLPNFFYGHTECDVFKINGSDFVVEYEIKISRNDFFADLKKKDKHEKLCGGVDKYCPNRFYYVTPENLVTIDEIPPYAGLLHYDGVALFDTIKNAKLLHKRKVNIDIFRDVCKTLAATTLDQRKRIIKLRNIDFDKEMNAMKREVEKLTKKNRDCSNERFIIRSAIRMIKNGETQRGIDLYEMHMEHQQKNNE